MPLTLLQLTGILGCNVVGDMSSACWTSHKNACYIPPKHLSSMVTSLASWLTWLDLNIPLFQSCGLWLHRDRLVTLLGISWRHFFYKDLYSSRAEYTDSQLNDYLAQISLPSLLAKSCRDLEAPLCVEEIAMAISQLAAHKTPGLDGFPTEWYSQFQHLICPFLLHTYNKALNAGIPPPMREALIILLLKPCKDPLKCDSYRPISLINVDVKILAKVVWTPWLRNWSGAIKEALYLANLQEWISVSVIFHNL